MPRRMSGSGHFRQIDTLPTLAACPLRSDRFRNSAPQRIDAECQIRTHAPQQIGYFYSITSSARASSVGGTVSPSILAVWALMTSSNLLDCTTGRSAGLSPLRTRAA